MQWRDWVSNLNFTLQLFFSFLPPRKNSKKMFINFSLCIMNVRNLVKKTFIHWISLKVKGGAGKEPKILFSYQYLLQVYLMQLEFAQAVLTDSLVLCMQKCHVFLLNGHWKQKLNLHKRGGGLQFPSKKNYTIKWAFKPRKYELTIQNSQQKQQK